jgi:lipoyl(octanoyl) transferase
MALDSTLFESVQAGAPPVLRFYLWRPACLSLGRNQPARSIYDPLAAAAAGVDIVRRPTGGLAVLHDAEVTYSVIASVDTIGMPRVAYRAINERLTGMLRRLGVRASLAGPADRSGGPGSTPGAGHAEAFQGTHLPPPCFNQPAAGEVIASGRKLVGSAQRCERRVLLQHGSILLDGSQLRIDALARGPVPPRREDGGTALGSLLGRVPAAAEVVAAAVAEFQDGGGIALAPAALDHAERERACAWEAEYRSDAWTWRR